MMSTTGALNLRMIQQYLSLPAIALSAVIGLGAAADAATVTFTQNYGTDFGAAGTATQGAAPRVTYGSNYARLNDGSGTPFYQQFSLAGIGNQINAISVTVNYANAGNGFFLSEQWQTFTAGALTGGGNLDTSSATRISLGTLVGSGSVTYQLTGTALTTALAADAVGIWFGEFAPWSNNFDLSSISVQVSAVPLPAGGVLLLGALGGLAVLRRRKASQPAA